MNRRLFPVTALLPLCAALLLPVASAQAEPGPRFGVPTDYFSRFGGAAPIFEVNDKNDLTRVGLSGVPLPTAYDLRFTVAKRPTTWDYSLSTRMNDTTYLIGIENDVRRLEVTHNPYTGPQFTGLLREKGVSELSGGYAQTALDGKVYILNKAGLAASGDIFTPFSYSQVGATFTEQVGKVNFRVSPIARLNLYPVEQAAHSSAEVTVAATTALTPQLLLEASHIERFAAGKSVIPEYGFGRVQETNLYATYRLPYTTDPAFTVGAVRGGYTHNWQTDWNYFKGDLLLRSSAIPVMFGPRAEYRMAPDGTSSWVYSLVTLSK